MQEIRTTIDIDAPPQVVWDVLLDFEKYPQWNPFIVSLEGEGAAGATLTEVVVLADEKRMTFRPKIQVCREHKELRWFATFLTGAVFGGEHFFELEPRNQGRGTRLIHGEIFTGLWVEYFGQKTIEDMKPRYALMNDKLKERVEKLVAEDPSLMPEATRTRLGDVLR